MPCGFVGCESFEVSWPRGKSLAERLAMKPRRTREQWPPACGRQQFFEAGKIWFKDCSEGEERCWEMVRRVVQNKSADGRPNEAVDVIALLRRPNREPALVLVLNYRPPVDAFVVELPAGLVDEGETGYQAAVRELKEETGFIAHKAGHMFASEMYPDPWKSSESYLSCTVDIDGSMPCNANPDPEHERDEHFAGVLVVPLSALEQALVQLARLGCKLEARTVAIAQGVTLARQVTE